MTRPTPRRPATSRGGTQRPRKIAGQVPVPAGAPAPDEVDDLSKVDDVSNVDEVEAESPPPVRPAAAATQSSSAFPACAFPSRTASASRFRRGMATM